MELFHPGIPGNRKGRGETKKIIRGIFPYSQPDGWKEVQLENVLVCDETSQAYFSL